MTTPLPNPGRTLAQRLAVQMQIHLPGTAGRLAKQLRELEALGPLFLRAGLVRPIVRPHPLTVAVAGIATNVETSLVPEGFLYAATAARADVLISDNVVGTTGEDSVCEIDDIDFEDHAKRLQLISIRQAYKLADAALRSPQHWDLILLRCPLVLNRSMAPLGDAPRNAGYRIEYERTLDAIRTFWEEHQKRVAPWTPDGTVVAGISDERFGAIVHVSQQDLRTVEGRRHVLGVEGIDAEAAAALADSQPTIAGIGERRFIHGILGANTRTAAFRMNVRTPEMEPRDVAGRGVLGMHFRAGSGSTPHLLQVVGDEPDWQRAALDRLAGLATALTVVGGQRAYPLPVHLAGSLQEQMGRFLDVFARGVRERIAKRVDENAYLTGLDELRDGESNR
jgi:hypothetical protein